MKGVTPILSAIPPDSTRNGRDDPHGGNPVVRAGKGNVEVLSWAFERPDGGRGYGFTGGHYHRNWGNDDYRKLMLNAILVGGQGRSAARRRRVDGDAGGFEGQSRQEAVAVRLEREGRAIPQASLAIRRRRAKLACGFARRRRFCERPKRICRNCLSILPRLPSDPTKVGLCRVCRFFASFRLS